MATPLPRFHQSMKSVSLCWCETGSVLHKKWWPGGRVGVGVEGVKQHAHTGPGHPSAPISTHQHPPAPTSALHPSQQAATLGKRHSRSRTQRRGGGRRRGEGGGGQNRGEDMTPSYERHRDPESVMCVIVGVLILSLHAFPDSVAGGKHTSGTESRSFLARAHSVSLIAGSYFHFSLLLLAVPVSLSLSLSCLPVYLSVCLPVCWERDTAVVMYTS